MARKIVITEDARKAAVAALKKLGAESSSADELSKLKADILAAKKRGAGMKSIAETLKESGITVSIKTLSSRVKEWETAGA